MADLIDARVHHVLTLSRLTGYFHQATGCISSGVALHFGQCHILAAVSAPRLNWRHSDGSTIHLKRHQTVDAQLYHLEPDVLI